MGHGLKLSYSEKNAKNSTTTTARKKLAQIWNP
jgi:hypothetical protein